jgi:hypothetical protein
MPSAISYNVAAQHKIIKQVQAVSRMGSSKLLEHDK